MDLSIYENENELRRNPHKISDEDLINWREQSFDKIQLDQSSKYILVPGDSMYFIDKSEFNKRFF